MALEPVLIIPDAHIPYEDVKAYNLMLKVAKAIKPKTIVIMGDFGDFYDISTYLKDPRGRVSFEDELNAVNKRLDELDGIGARRKLFLEGNHEERLTRYLLSNAPKLVNTFSTSKAFRLRERGWKFTPYRGDTRIGKLYLTHDAGHAGVTAPRLTYQAYQHNVAFGHTHNLSVEYHGNATGETHVVFNCGWLGDKKHIDYAHRVKAYKRYITGFGVGYLEQGGTCHLSAIPIVNNRCVVNGKLYK